MRWFCPNCGMENNEQYCRNCGTERPGQVSAETQYENGQESSYYANATSNDVYGMPQGYTAPAPQKDNKLGIVIVICISVLLLAIIGVFAAFILTKDKGESETVAVTEVTAPEETTVAVTTPVPTVAPTATPTVVPTPVPTPTPNRNETKRTEFLNRAEEIEQFAYESSQSAMTQVEINRASGQIFSKWDILLNDVYQYLKKVLPSGQFKTLKEEELAWIKEKEAAVAAEGEAWGNGSGRPMAENGVATEYTKTRCYELIAMIP